MITIVAFNNVPPFARGLVRDLRPRWALEEAGIPYEVRLIGREDQSSAAYRMLQPFGQVPVLQDGELTLFESGAILMHIAAKSDKLLPRDPIARERAGAWVFAALNSVEPWLQQFAGLDAFHAGEEWARLRRPSLETQVRTRLGDLSVALGDKDYLEGGFTAGDLMMATVLRLLRHTDIVAEYANLRAYLDRCEARPAFHRALRAQLEVFEQHAAA